MSNGMVRKLYPGGNTSKGFYSFYDNIIAKEKDERLIILKGGPGVGKSSFMKRIGQYFYEQGYDIEYLYCSSDNDSLDGVKIPELGYAVIDGTAPHVVDPKTPGAVDEILNFGEFWDEERIGLHKEQIIQTSAQVSGCFTRAYRFLQAAHSIYEDVRYLYESSLEEMKLHTYAMKLSKELLDGKENNGHIGRVRKMFLSAITPKGLKNYLDTAAQGRKVYVINSTLGGMEDRLLEQLKETLRVHGLDLECCYCAFNPSKLEHLVIPKLGVAIITKNEYHHPDLIGATEIDLDEFYRPDVMIHYSERLTEDKKYFDDLMDCAIQNIQQAKSLHDQLEEYYVPNIDFSQIDRCFEKVVQKMMS